MFARHLITKGQRSGKHPMECSTTLTRISMLPTGDRFQNHLLHNKMPWLHHQGFFYFRFSVFRHYHYIIYSVSVSVS
jgi:hypothetical protein